MSETIAFWNNQITLLELGKSVILVAREIRKSSLYKPNNFTDKIDSILFRGSYNSEKDIMCVCTHFALQITGIET